MSVRIRDLRPGDRVAVEGEFVSTVIVVLPSHPTQPELAAVLWRSRLGMLVVLAVPSDEAIENATVTDQSEDQRLESLRRAIDPPPAAALPADESGAPSAPRFYIGLLDEGMRLSSRVGRGVYPGGRMPDPRDPIPVGWYRTPADEQGPLLYPVSEAVAAAWNGLVDEVVGRCLHLRVTRRMDGALRCEADDCRRVVGWMAAADIPKIAGHTPASFLQRMVDGRAEAGTDPSEAESSGLGEAVEVVFTWAKDLPLAPRRAVAEVLAAVGQLSPRMPDGLSDAVAALASTIDSSAGATAEVIDRFPGLAHVIDRVTRFADPPVDVYRHSGAGRSTAAGWVRALRAAVDVAAERMEQDVAEFVEVRTDEQRGFEANTRAAAAMCVGALVDAGWRPEPARGAYPDGETVHDVARPEAGGAAMIAAERRRQVDVEGWTAGHDAEHSGDELALASVCYALPPYRRGGLTWSRLWPWPAEAWKPSRDDRVRELVKAGALIAAEIDRLRAAEQSDGGEHGE